ncbi:uncharacterized protein LOC110110672 isoform X3 [Dendrobium catenatum]|uniref:uncharacterized protein LOC110110672 isoform X3 n=1 Tax=Dendrobium catenatum TaxID=906689 RepID=UPI0010A0AC00|nr:uncharacterized protein LOC110110672 isoform X3 [Dendrobium catenatum]
MSNNFLFYHCSNKGRGSSFHHPVCLWTSKIKLKLGALECSLRSISIFTQRILINLVSEVATKLQDIVTWCRRHPFSDSVKQDASSDGLYESNIHSGVSNGGKKVKADRDESSPYADMLAANDAAQRCKELGISALHIMIRATEGNKTKTPCPGAQSALRATTHSGMKIGRISQQLARIWGQVE